MQRFGAKTVLNPWLVRLILTSLLFLALVTLTLASG
jgi:hypothetical protein